MVIGADDLTFSYFHQNPVPSRTITNHCAYVELLAALVVTEAQRCPFRRNLRTGERVSSDTGCLGLAQRLRDAAHAGPGSCGPWMIDNSLR